MLTHTNEVQDLIEELNKCRNAYYNEDISLISDREYDEKYDRLCKLEEETGIIYANSPTQNVGYEVKSSLTKVKHNHPLLSLAKTTDINEFSEYFGDKIIVLMAKMDGLTCSLLYRGGILVRAESRGNGEVGEDITHNARVISNIPLEIPFKGELIVDGECIIDYQTFNEINQRENTEYKNPRNLVSGTMRQLNNAIAANRNVKFIAWRLHSMTDPNGGCAIEKNTFSNCFCILNSFGFSVVPHAFIEPMYIEKCAEQIRNICDRNHFPIDGLVGSFNNIDYGLSLGSTSHHPKHSLAFKFYQERNETTLRFIEWSVSRTGLVNPVAVFDPVEIDGTTVSRATLSNVSIIKELELGIGDTVTVIKANQIIPAITENLTKSGTYEIPTICPCCASPITIRCDNNREMLYCNNEKCHDRVVDKLVNFCGKNGMDILGLSRETIDYLVTAGYINQYADIYNLRFANRLENANGFGKARVAKLIDSINNSKARRLENVIVAIGIPGVGKSNARAIAKYCESVASDKDNLLQLFVEYSLNEYDWTCLDDFGETTRDGINKYVAQHISEIEPLCDILEIEHTNIPVSNNILNGNTFCITGKLEVFPNRNALVTEIEKNGGKVVSGVTAKTDYLITNDKRSGSSKNVNAAKYGTRIITEKEFIILCETKP